MHTGTPPPTSPWSATALIVAFKTYVFPITGADGIERVSAPGAVERNEGGDAVLLHVGPGDFLAPAPTPVLMKRLEAMQANGIGRIFDVSGKWLKFDLQGPVAERCLLSTVDPIRILRGRDCASVHLFDCPAILARRAGGFEAWIGRSHAAAFIESFGLSETSLDSNSMGSRSSVSVVHTDGHY